MSRNCTSKKEKLMPLLQELAGLKYYHSPHKPITRSQISLFGDPFTRTDFSDFSKRCQQFLRAVPDPPESEERKDDPIS